MTRPTSVVNCQTIIHKWKPFFLVNWVNFVVMIQKMPVIYQKYPSINLYGKAECVYTVCEKEERERKRRERETDDEVEKEFFLKLIPTFDSINIKYTFSKKTTHTANWQYFFVSSIWVNFWQRNCQFQRWHSLAWSTNHLTECSQRASDWARWPSDNLKCNIRCTHRWNRQNRKIACSFG